MTLLYRQGGFDKFFDDTISFLQDVMDIVPRDVYIALLVDLTSGTPELINQTKDAWLFKSYKTMVANPLPAIAASVVVATLGQDGKESFPQNISDALHAFDEKHRTNLHALLAKNIYAVDILGAANLKYAVENKNVDLIVDEINITFDKGVLLWLLSSSPVTGRGDCVLIAALKRLKKISPPDFYALCKDHSEFFIRRKAYELLLKSHPDIAHKSGHRARVPSGVSPQVWNIYRDGLEELYSGTCPASCADDDIKNKTDKAYERLLLSSEPRKTTSRLSVNLAKAVPDIDVDDFGDLFT